MLPMVFQAPKGIANFFSSEYGSVSFGGKLTLPYSELTKSAILRGAWKPIGNTCFLGTSHHDRMVRRRPDPLTPIDSFWRLRSVHPCPPVCAVDSRHHHLDRQLLVAAICAALSKHSLRARFPKACRQFSPTALIDESKDHRAQRSSVAVSQRSAALCVCIKPPNHERVLD